MRRDLARDVGVVLDGDRHAQQWRRVGPGERGSGPVGLLQRLLGEHDAEGVQVWIDALDTLEQRLYELTRRDLTPADELRLAPDPGER